MLQPLISYFAERRERRERRGRRGRRERKEKDERDEAAKVHLQEFPFVRALNTNLVCESTLSFRLFVLNHTLVYF